MMTEHEDQAGVVYLVGAGPGDPELITVKGLRLLRQADVVIYDRLVPPQLLRQTSPQAEMIYAGKAPGHHALRQEQINALLIDRARKGHMVVRLKGGDPSVFGRAGEEIAALRAVDIPYVIVPGVTAAVAGAAGAGLSLTHRNLSSVVVLTTGTEAEEGESPSSTTMWQSLGNIGGTLVFYMAVKQLGTITNALIRAGRSPEESALVIQEACTAREKIVVGTLADIAAKSRAAAIQPPALLICGKITQA
ncbi:MAG TPA: uroporphyrinogen-III C-methyltransferase [Alphaproteobacteria bacterium]|nr:uroporphyrinogen-III C-methyltransferase [Alphaproteobacteria bacterium]